jgi:acyl-[acyl-carrier-protein]-phospholipid O-acyltransferase / long-chain-fatty-acid--[acyl-carrier-protein] ligase
MPTGQKCRGLILRLFGSPFRLSFDKAKTFGLENLPDKGFLLLPNNLSGLNAVVLQLACPRPIRFIVNKSIYGLERLYPFFRSKGAIPVQSVLAEEAVSEAANRIRQGEIVCVVPEAELTRSRIPIELHKEFELIARLSEEPVVPVWLDRFLPLSCPSERERHFFERSNWSATPVAVAFGNPISKDAFSIGLARERLLELGEFCFEHRPGLNEHLGRAAIRGLRQNQFRDLVIDGIDHRRIKGGNLAAVSIALSRVLKRDSGGRVAVVLPPGIGAVVANAAITLADKTPVNLNFTVGRSALQSAIQQGQIRLAISAEPVIKRLAEFPWPEEVYRLESVVSRLKAKILLWRIAVLLMPAWLISSLLRLPSKSGREEGVILFTSGTTGEPKGVVLSHRNIISNVMQFRSVVHLDRNDTLMASLPFFHCFGSTVTLWHPLIKGVRIVTYPSPVDAPKNAELVQKYRVTLLPTTPTFLRAYLKHCEPKQFASVRLLVTGAEKLPRELAESFEQKFGLPVLEGYGLTETAPVVSVDLPDNAVQSTHRMGSVGRPLPGQAAQIRDPASGELLKPHQLGMLWLKGPNVFERYLGEDERRREVFQDGWFRTGDLARFDEEGFLYIEGRYSRFSKIAGEMVPHETLETKILELLGFETGEQGIVTVVGVPDRSKGELLVLLTTRDLSRNELRKRLLAAGVPILWIPKVVKRIEKIPILGTGKVDLSKCQQLAMER